MLIPDHRWVQGRDEHTVVDLDAVVGEEYLRAYVVLVDDELPNDAADSLHVYSIRGREGRITVWNIQSRLQVRRVDLGKVVREGPSPIPATGMRRWWWRDRWRRWRRSNRGRRRWWRRRQDRWPRRDRRLDASSSWLSRLLFILIIIVIMLKLDLDPVSLNPVSPGAFGSVEKGPLNLLAGSPNRSPASFAIAHATLYGTAEGVIGFRSGARVR
jgi:hypothetical protein